MSHLMPDKPDREILSGAIITAPNSDTVLEAEIIETESEEILEEYDLIVGAKPRQNSHNSSEALANWLLLEGSATLVPDYLYHIKTRLAFLLTPCRLSTLGVLLLANLLLAWSQLAAPKNGASVQTTSELAAPLVQPQGLPNSPTINLAAEKPELAANSLSTAAPASQPAESVKQHQTAPLGTAVPTPSLTNALLPYLSAQPPQPVQPYPTAQVTVAPPPPAPVPQYFPFPALPSVQQPPMVEPPPPPSPEEMAKQSIIRQDLDRIRLERENLPPLGFNQEYRVKVQSRQTQSDANQLRQQLQHLQQQAIPAKLE